MKLNLKIAVSLFALILTHAVANAGGFSLYDTWSARTTGMGGAALANEAEPASIAINPALITRLEGTQVQAGLSMISIGATATVAGVARETEPEMFYIPNAYISTQFNDNVYFGLGFFSRYGLGETYKDYKSWAGSAIAYSSRLETFSLNPNIAVKVNDDLSLAMGVEIMTLSFKEKKYLALPMTSELNLEGDSIAWGGNFAAYYNPWWAPKWGAGLVYRTKTNHLVDGKVDTTGAFALAAPSGNATAPITLPDSISFGVSHSPLEKLIVEANITGTFWSSYKTLRVDYNDTNLSLIEKKNYKDVFKLSIGAEYALTDNWDVRAGYTFDQSPVNGGYMDTLVPAHDRNIYAVGVGYTAETWGVDLAYSYYQIADLNGFSADPVLGTVPVSYEDSSSSVIALSVKYLL